MTPLQTAAQAVIDRWDSPKWKNEGSTAGYIDALRIALAASEQEPVAIYQYQMSDGSWVDQVQASYEYNRLHAPLTSTVRIVYAAPPEIEALTKERDSYALALSSAMLREIKAEAERDALMQAAKLALDALEDAHKYAHNVGRYLHGVPQAIAALKKAGVQ
jgi:hypothetical protein